MIYLCYQTLLYMKKLNQTADSVILGGMYRKDLRSQCITLWDWRALQKIFKKALKGNQNGTFQSSASAMASAYMILLFVSKW